MCFSEEMTPENGCLTPTMKLIRNAAKEKFIESIREMYGGGALQGEE
jgi:long-subunit acyl-CoA synthetase (AMP-forming)